MAGYEFRSTTMSIPWAFVRVLLGHLLEFAMTNLISKLVQLKTVSDVSLFRVNCIQ